MFCTTVHEAADKLRSIHSSVFREAPSRRTLLTTSAPTRHCQMRTIAADV